MPLKQVRRSPNTMLYSLLSFFSAKSLSWHYLYCQIWPIKYIRFFQLFSIWRLNSLVIILLQDTCITKAFVSPLKQYAEKIKKTSRVLGTQSISRAQPNKHPLHFNPSRFTHFTLSCFVALLQCLQFILRLQLNFPLPLISSPCHKSW